MVLLPHFDLHPSSLSLLSRLHVRLVRNSSDISTITVAVRGHRVKKVLINCYKYVMAADRQRTMLLTAALLGNYSSYYRNPGGNLTITTYFFQPFMVFNICIWTSWILKISLFFGAFAFSLCWLPLRCRSCRLFDIHLICEKHSGSEKMWAPTCAGRVLKHTSAT